MDLRTVQGEFLTKKLDLLINRRVYNKNSFPEFDIEIIKGFGFEKIEAPLYNVHGVSAHDADKSHAFSNNDGCKCFLYKMSYGYVIKIAIDGVSSKPRRLKIKPVALLYRCMEEMGEIAMVFRQIKSKLEEFINESEQKEKRRMDEFVSEIRHLTEKVPKKKYVYEKHLCFAQCKQNPTFDYYLSPRKWKRKRK